MLKSTVRAVMISKESLALHMEVAQAPVCNEHSQEAAGVRTNLYHIPYPGVPPSSIPL
jgi:hypothetical protein